MVLKQIWMIFSYQSIADCFYLDRDLSFYKKLIW